MQSSGDDLITYVVYAVILVVFFVVLKAPKNKKE